VPQQIDPAALFCCIHETQPITRGDDSDIK
jgi:hypothetical protein